MYGAHAQVIRADVSQEAEVAALVREALAQLGRINILVNNACVAHADTVDTLQAETRDRAIGVHQRSTFLLTRAVPPGNYGQVGDRIIKTASQLACKGAAGLLAYAAAKGGIIALFPFAGARDRRA